MTGKLNVGHHVSASDISGLVSLPIKGEMPRFERMVDDVFHDPSYQAYGSGASAGVSTMSTTLGSSENRSWDSVVF